MITEYAEYVQVMKYTSYISRFSFTYEKCITFYSKLHGTSSILKEKRDRGNVIQYTIKQICYMKRTFPTLL